jgi:hypothetical protein
MVDMIFPPGPKMTLNLGIFGVTRRDTIRFFQQIFGYRSIFQAKLFGRYVYMLNGPELIRGVLALAATLAQRWSPRLAGSAPVGLQPMITLRLQGGVPMVLEEAK